MVEDADEVNDLEAAPVVEAELANRSPVVLGHARRRRRKLLRDRAERAVANGEALDGTPLAPLDRFREVSLAAFDTQKLCVRLRSVVTVLGGGRDRREHLALAPVEGAGSEHDAREERPERVADLGVRGDQAPHRGEEPEIVWMARHPGADLFLWRQLHPGVRRHGRLASTESPAGNSA